MVRRCSRHDWTQALPLSSDAYSCANCNVRVSGVDGIRIANAGSSSIRALDEAVSRALEVGVLVTAADMLDFVMDEVGDGR